MQHAVVESVFKDPELEKQVLAALAADADVFYRYAEDYLTPDVFADPANREIFNEMDAAFAAGQEPPEVCASPVADVGAAVRKLVDLAQRRKAAEVVANFWSHLGAGKPVGDVLAAAIEKLVEAQQAVKSVSPGETKVLPELLKSIEARYREEYKLLQETGRPNPHPSFGKDLPTLTELTGGFAPGVWVLGGQPGVGKTFLALTWAYRYVAAESDTAALWVDVQETRPVDLLALRLACIHCRKYPVLFERRKASPSEFTEICAKAAAVLGNRVAILEANHNTTVAHLRGAVRRLMAQTGAKRCMVVLDYLQKFGMLGGGENLTEARARINRAVAQMTEIVKVANGPVILISSLGKDAYRRKVEDANVADFKESGEVEYQGDVGIILRWAKDDRNQCKDSAVKVIEAWFVKNRMGPTAVVCLYSVRAESRYTEFDPGDISLPWVTPDIDDVDLDNIDF